jgi:hypothetical protein
MRITKGTSLFIGRFPFKKAYPVSSVLKSPCQQEMFKRIEKIPETLYFVSFNRLAHIMKDSVMGSRKGIPNKLTKDIKEILHVAFHKAGGVDYLIRQAENEPKAFMALLGRCIPATVAVSVEHKFDLGAAMIEQAKMSERLNNVIDITPEPSAPVEPKSLKYKHK